MLGDGGESVKRRIKVNLRVHLHSRSDRTFTPIHITDRHRLLPDAGDADVVYTMSKHIRGTVYAAKTRHRLWSFPLRRLSKPPLERKRKARCS